MVKTNFMQMADTVEKLADGEEMESRAHILVRALMIADEHAPEHVVAFAGGCNENAYAKGLRPLLMVGATVEDGEHVRGAINVIFNKGVEDAWQAWRAREVANDVAPMCIKVDTGALTAAPERPASYKEDPRAGLIRFLDCTTPTRECRQIVLN